MGVKYRSVFNSNDGVVWTIYLYDSTYSSTILDFRSGPDGFTMNYKGGESRFSPIIASECRVTMMVENTTMDSFINDLSTDTGGRYYMGIYKNSVFWWGGVITGDLATKSDEYYTYPIQLVATDGLGKLKDVRYDDNGTPYTGRESLLTHIRKILGKTGLDGFWGANDVYLKTAVHWYDQNMIRGNEWCPLKATDVDNDCFLEWATSEQYLLNMPLAYTVTVLRGKDCNTVLQRILSLMDCRLLQSEGKWWVLQVPHLAEQLIYTRSFKKSDAFISYNPEEQHKISATYYTRSKGGTWEYLPTLRRVERKYAWRYSKYGNSLIGEEPSNAVEYTCGEVFKGKLVTKGTIEQSYLGGAGQGYIDVFKLTVKYTQGASTFYLKQQGDYYFWTMDAAYVEIQTDYHVGQAWEENFELNIVSPELSWQSYYTVGNVVTWKIEYWKSINESGQTITFGPSETHTYAYKEFSLCVQGFEGGNRLYYANNLKPGVTPATYVDSQNVEIITESLMGDLGIDTTASPPTYKPGCGVGRLKIRRADGNWRYSTGWALGALTDYITINQLAVNQAINGQKVPCEKFQGSIISTTYAAWKVLMGASSRYYVPMELAFTASMDEWSGMWFNIRNMTAGGGGGGGSQTENGIGAFNQGAAWDDTTNWTDAPLVGLNEMVEEDQSARASRSNSWNAFKRTGLVRGFAYDIITQMKIASTDRETPAGSTTTININPIGHKMLIRGDMIGLMDVNTWRFHRLQVDADMAGDGDTTLTIVSYNFPYAIPSGAVLVYDSLSLYKKLIV